MRSQVAGPLVLFVLAVPATLAWAADPSGSSETRSIAPRAAKSLAANVSSQPGNRFALELYDRLRAKIRQSVPVAVFDLDSSDDDIVRARGKTLEQMKRTLHLPSGNSPTRSQSLVSLEGSHKVQKRRPKGYQLQIANALWRQTGQPFVESFLKRTSHGAAKQVDFAGDSEKARRTINGWVEKQTSNHIKDLLPAGAVDQQTKLVLINAIYFKGDWASPFKKANTREGAFQVSPDKSVKVHFMSQTGQFGYYQTMGLQVLELPYAGKDLSLIALLPKKSDDLPVLEKALSMKRLEACLKGLTPTRVEVVLPRFRLAAEIGLNQTLESMGMPLAFAPEADFSGIDSKGGLRLSAVFHKAFIDVNEQGSEAGAATSQTMKAKSIAAPPRVFRANRPFVFLILDKRSGSVLFLDRLVNPRL